MVNYLKKLRNEQHRAVAPIIATLIMVAIAVVGGVMVYVFTQGFFTGTQTQAPTTDALQMTGYDAREIAEATGITDHRGIAIVNAGDGATAGKAADEEIALHIKNLGTNEVTIGKLEVNFVGYAGTTGAIAANLPDAGQYTILTTASPTTGVSSIPAGQEVTVLVSITGTTIAAGASVPVELVTGTGSTFTFHPVIGQRE